MSEVGNAIWEKLLPSISPLITIFKVVAIVLLFYIIFLILRALFRWKTSLDIGKIAKNVEQINGKLDILISRLEYKEMKQRVEEGKETKQKFEGGKKKKGIFRRLFGRADKGDEEEDKEKIKKKKGKKIVTEKNRWHSYEMLKKRNRNYNAS